MRPGDQDLRHAFISNAGLHIKELLCNCCRQYFYITSCMFINQLPVLTLVIRTVPYLVTIVTVREQKCRLLLNQCTTHTRTLTSLYQNTFTLCLTCTLHQFSGVMQCASILLYE